MATPPELYDMCGLSVQIDPSIVEQVQTILKEHKISTSGLFWYEKGELAVPYEAQTSVVTPKSQTFWGHYNRLGFFFLFYKSFDSYII